MSRGMISRAWNALVNGLVLFACVLIAADCLLIVVDVTLRNFGRQPPAYTVALTEYSLLYMTMAAGPWLVRERAWIVVEVIYRRTALPLRTRLDRLIFGICTLVSVIVAVLAGILAVEGALRGEVEIRSLDMPRWALFAPLALGFGMMAVEFLRCLLRGDSMAQTEADVEQAF